jgi:rod shape-determining protein MreC
MRNLILFFIRYNGFFIFLLLEMISLSLLVRNNDIHKEAYRSASEEFVGFVYSKYNGVIRYWDLASVNDSLLHENAKLREQLRNSFFDHNVDSSVVRDTLFQAQYKYIEAMVVDNSTTRMNNYLTINRGKHHGVKPNSGVLNATGSGIVGIVRKVSTNYSAVMSVLHMDTRISCKIKRNNYFGTLSWDGRSPRYMVLNAIPKHADVIQGDSVTTSGFSSMFPEGILVGIVDTFYLEPGSNFYHIRVNLSSDLSNVEYAYVVDNLMSTELDSLMQSVENE